MNSLAKKSRPLLTSAQSAFSDVPQKHKIRKQKINIEAKPKQDIFVDGEKGRFVSEIEGSQNAFQLKPVLKMMHWNINSVHTKLESEILAQYLNANDFDIVSLNETKYSPDRFQSFLVHEHELWANRFNQYWAFSTRKLGYSGVTIFSKAKALSWQCGLGIDEFDAEGRILTLEFDYFYLLSVYAPNSAVNRLEKRVEQWEQAFKAHLLSLKAKKNVIVLGDLNVAHKEIDVVNPKTAKGCAGFTEEERQCFSELLAPGFTDVFRRRNPDKIEYTWWSFRGNGRAKNLGWRLDYCVVNEEAFDDVLSFRHRSDVTGSDHCPLEIEYRHFASESPQINNDNKEGNDA
jgi:exodeoxyribonuclease III